MIAAQGFCNAFATQSDLSTILAHFSSSAEVLAFEHGLPRLAPFLGRPFKGPDAIKDYFSVVAEHLSYRDMRFEEFVVDVEASKVSARGRATFTWKSTGQSWDEIFAYILSFDGHDKVKTYEIWADSGAAYLARTGQLTDQGQT